MCEWQIVTTITVWYVQFQWSIITMIISPFQLNEALVDVLCNADKKLQNIILQMLIYMRKLTDQLDTITGQQWTKAVSSTQLLNLCQATLSNEWDLR